jgi:hypothetical protein
MHIRLVALEPIEATTAGTNAELHDLDKASSRDLLKALRSASEEFERASSWAGEFDVEKRLLFGSVTAARFRAGADALVLMCVDPLP